MKKTILFLLLLFTSTLFAQVTVLGTQQGYPYNVTYGIEWDIQNPLTTVTRIGRQDMHVSLPIQSNMKGCLLSDAGTVNSYLPSSGTWAGQTLDGSSGQVMVEIPDYWYVIQYNGSKRRMLLSAVALTGFTKSPKCYISAYEASVQRSTSKLCSVVTTSADYRGGDNTSAWDGAANTLLGRPVTNLSRTTFRTYARNRGDVRWNMLTYTAHKSVFWLYYVEYAQLNCQTAFNASKDGSGYSQGGLGDGVTTWDAAWGTFNSYNPFVACGYTNSIGNGTGIVSLTVPSTSKTFDVPRYRGIENPFGHIWKNCDGVTINVLTDAAGGTSEVFTSNTPSLFNDSNVTGYNSVGFLQRYNDYVGTLILGVNGEILPSYGGGTSTTYWSDYFYTDINSSSLRTLLFGGNAHLGAASGFGSTNSYYSPAIAATDIGSRLCFIP
jgi:hypothetical protein